MTTTPDFLTTGLQLPLLPEGIHAARQPAELGSVEYAAGRQGRSAISRVVFAHSDDPDIGGLTALLEAADPAAEELADLCGASVIPHAWNLIRTDDEYPFDFPQPLVPAKHLVTLTTPVVKGWRHLNTDSARVSAGIKDYNASQEYVLPNVHLDMFRSAGKGGAILMHFDPTLVLSADPGTGRRI